MREPADFIRIVWKAEFGADGRCTRLKNKIDYLFLKALFRLQTSGEFRGGIFILSPLFFTGIQGVFSK